jgi:prepilin-type N-terminal cleavage/methylation domain-containing protein
MLELPVAERERLSFVFMIPVPARDNNQRFDDLNIRIKSMKKDQIGFTLIEIMVAIAIIGILAAVVLVSMNTFGAKARSSRAMAQASSAMSSMASCWGNGGDVISGTNICSLGSGYGAWPILPTGYTYSGNSITRTQSLNPWVFRVTGESQTICCNSKMNSCGQPSSCDVNATW